MTQRPHGTRGTARKLRTVFDYLDFYTTALPRRFRLTYLDAFAGAGDVPFKDKLPLLDGILEYEKVFEGSAQKSLKLRRPFDRYIFNDGIKSNVNSLAKLKIEFPHLADRIQIVQQDANQIVTDYCRSHDPSRDRAVIFLDPWGNSVNWQTIELIAQTKGIDLWYLFPSGLGVVRQISQDASINPDAAPSIDRIMPSKSWRDIIAKPSAQGDMFTEQGDVVEKIATADSITRYFIGELKKVFHGVVLDEWLALGAKNGHWYSLVFACSNDSENAKKLAGRVAKDIMRKR